MAESRGSFYTVHQKSCIGEVRVVDRILDARVVIVTCKIDDFIGHCDYNFLGNLYHFMLGGCEARCGSVLELWRRCH